MPLKPLEQFICDGCNEPVDKADSYIEWLRLPDNQGKGGGFRIIHNNRKCRAYPDSEFLLDMPIGDLSHDDMLPYLLSKIDVGERLQPKYSGPRVADLREYVELIRRLLIPYYEEAASVLFDGDNEITANRPSACQKFVNKCSNL